MTGFIVAVLLALIPTHAVHGSDLESRVRQIIDTANLGQTKVSIYIVDLTDSASLVEIGADRHMIPASNMKLITTAAAIEHLGLDFVFETRLELLTSEEMGQCLRVFGDGDPAFGDPKLLEQFDLDFEKLIDQWVQAVVDTGQKRFEQLIIDDSVFDREFVHPDWPKNQLHKWYCAQVAGINFYDNCLDILPLPGARYGHSARIRIYPEVPFIETSNRVITGKTDHFTLDRRPNTNYLIFGGSVRNAASRPFAVTVHDPPILFGELLKHRLSKKGISVGDVRRPSLDDPVFESKTLHRVQTTLPLVLNRCNQDSMNLFAEALIKRMGRAITGRPGSFDNGAAAIRMFLSKRLGTSGAAVTVADGSGLSRRNRVTARLLVRLLETMHKDAAAGLTYRNSLSLAGKTGSLTKRMETLESQVYAKTGYINRVSSLSGYMVIPGQDEDQPDRTIAFSMLFNDFKPPIYLHHLKKLQDQIITATDQAFRVPIQLGG